MIGRTIGIAACTALAMGLGVPGAHAQSMKQQLVGTWTLTSVDNTAPDGSKRDLFGPSPKGVLILDGNGYFAQVQVRSDRPKMEANNRLQGTAEENKAAIAGAYASAGRWEFDDASKTLTRNIVASATFPNEEGRTAKWIMSLSGDQLTVDAGAPSAGGKTVLVFQRVK